MKLNTLPIKFYKKFPFWHFLFHCVQESNFAAEQLKKLNILCAVHAARYAISQQMLQNERMIYCLGILYFVARNVIQLIIFWVIMVECNWLYFNEQRKTTVAKLRILNKKLRISEWRFVTLF